MRNLTDIFSENFQSEHLKNLVKNIRVMLFVRIMQFQIHFTLIVIKSLDFCFESQCLLKKVIKVDVL